MFCSECGKPLNEGADFCLKCGKSVNRPRGEVVAQQRNKAGFNKTIGIVFISIAGFFLFLSFIFIGIATDYEYVYDSYYSSSYASNQFTGYLVLASMFFIGAVILGVASALMNKKTCDCGSNCNCCK